MNRANDWVVEQEELYHEALGAGMKTEKEIIEYISDNSRGRRVDASFIRSLMNSGMEDISEYLPSRYT
jgi:hypothetical protein